MFNASLSQLFKNIVQHARVRITTNRGFSVFDEKHKIKIIDVGRYATKSSFRLQIDRYISKVIFFLAQQVPKQIRKHATAMCKKHNA